LPLSAGNRYRLVRAVLRQTLLYVSGRTTRGVTPRGALRHRSWTIRRGRRGKWPAPWSHSASARKFPTSHPLTTLFRCQSTRGMTCLRPPRPRPDTALSRLKARTHAFTPFGAWRLRCRPSSHSKDYRRFQPPRHPVAGGEQWSQRHYRRLRCRSKASTTSAFARNS
jgi:hypothetical protein